MATKPGYVRVSFSAVVDGKEVRSSIAVPIAEIKQGRAPVLERAVTAEAQRYWTALVMMGLMDKSVQ